MEESRKLSGKDLITIGIFSAIYFMLNLAAMFTGFVPVLWLLLPGVTGIVTGIPFLLMTAKVRKPGAVFIMGTITALLYFVTGQFTVLLLITFAIACILSELYRSVTKYDNSFTHMMVSFVFFCYGMLGSPLAIWGADSAEWNVCRICPVFIGIDFYANADYTLYLSSHRRRDWSVDC